MGIISKKQVLVASLMICGLLAGSMEVDADQILGNTKKFVQTNPDVMKYEFTRDFLTSLNYLRENDERFEDIAILAFTEEKDIKGVALLRDDLIRNNLNLRIARNYLKKYLEQRENGLMIKVADMFTEMCNQMIDYNNQEKKLLEELYYVQLKDEMDSFNMDRFTQRQNRIAQSRKKVLKKLLQTSMVASKVLISNQENYYGEFDKLGITQEQRYKLLYRIDEFETDAYKGELRAGQTFLEGSIVTIREMLENYDYETIDG